MRAFRRILCGLIMSWGLIVASGAAATSATTDQSDLWYIPAESGWGIQTVQRDTVMFATLYVYDINYKPVWYVATLTYQGNLVWSGDLLVTTGPWFGTTPFDPMAVTNRRVGMMTWTSVTVDTARLSYSVDGVNVLKNVVRQSLALEDYSGHFAGGTHATRTGCTNPILNVVTESMSVLYVTQNGYAFDLTSYPLAGGSCSYSGTLSQAGQMGSLGGSYTCSSGETGSFVIFEMQVNITGLTGRFTSQSPSFPGCQTSGWFGGMRSTTL